MNRRMPFGKYAGVPIDELPDWYLDWVASQDWVREPLMGYLRTELKSRGRRIPRPRASTMSGPVDSPLGNALTRAGLRVLKVRR